MLNSQQATSLADVLASTVENAGPAPKKYSIPFLVVDVKPIPGGNCKLRVVTNGMDYQVLGDHDHQGCSHLPRRHTLVWGRIRLGKRSSEYIDLVYENDAKVEAQAYNIIKTSAISSDWGR